MLRWLSRSLLRLRRDFIITRAGCDFVSCPVILSLVRCLTAHRTCGSLYRHPNRRGVLTLHPGPDGSPIHANLSEINLKGVVPYEALSYTWGTEDHHQQIYVNGQAIQIWHNLYRFLVQLRRQIKEPRWLWIDAIPISQSDPVEKGLQVAIIGDIFKKASRVLIWIGEHADGSELLFRTEPMRPSSGWNLIFDKRSRDREAEYEMQARAQRWSAFFARPYWHRLWVLQEILLAKAITVHCGDDYQDWDRILRAKFEGRDRDYFDGILISMADKWRADSLNTGDQVKFRNVLWRMELYVIPWCNNLKPLGLTETIRWSMLLDLQCLDRRDRIYALLSLQSGDTTITPDYTIDAPELLLRWHKDNYISGHKLTHRFTWGSDECRADFIYQAQIIADMIDYLKFTPAEQVETLRRLYAKEHSQPFGDIEFMYTAPMVCAAKHPGPGNYCENTAFRFRELLDGDHRVAAAAVRTEATKLMQQATQPEYSQY